MTKENEKTFTVYHLNETHSHKISHPGEEILDQYLEPALRLFVNDLKITIKTVDDSPVAQIAAEAYKEKSIMIVKNVAGNGAWFSAICVSTHVQAEKITAEVISVYPELKKPPVIEVPCVFIHKFESYKDFESLPNSFCMKIMNFVWNICWIYLDCVSKIPVQKEEQEEFLRETKELLERYKKLTANDGESKNVH